MWEFKIRAVYQIPIEENERWGPLRLMHEMLQMTQSGGTVQGSFFNEGTCFEGDKPMLTPWTCLRSRRFSPPVRAP